MRTRITGVLGVSAAVLAIVMGTSCNKQVIAASALSQTEAEKVSSNIYISSCHPPQPDLVRTVMLGKPNPNGHLREQYGPVMVYPVQVTWTGKCSGHMVGPQQVDFFENVDARYTASYYKDQFGNWAHTPFVGTCRWVYKAYQQTGGPVTPVPNAHVGSCGIADTIND